MLKHAASPGGAGAGGGRCHGAAELAKAAHQRCSPTARRNPCSCRGGHAREGESIASRSEQGAAGRGRMHRTVPDGKGVAGSWVDHRHCIKDSLRACCTALVLASLAAVVAVAVGGELARVDARTAARRPG